MKEVLLIGEVSSDYLILGKTIPQKGTSLLLDEKELPGGSGLNSAFHLYHWGIPVELWGNPVGADVYGKKILQYLKEWGISYHVKEQKEGPTFRCICLVDYQNQSRSFLISSTEIREDFSFPFEKLQKEPPSICFLDFFLPQARKALPFFPETTLLLSQDLKPDSPFIGSIHYLQLSVPEEDWNLGDLEKKASLYFQGKTKGIIFTGGQKGVFYWGKEGKIFLPPISVETVDTTGAGDAFRAGFIYGLYHKMPLRKSLELANYAGAQNTRFLGGHGRIHLSEFFEKDQNAPSSFFPENKLP